jgi:hypothetical protein
MELEARRRNRRKTTRGAGAHAPATLSRDKRDCIFLWQRTGRGGKSVWGVRDLCLCTYKQRALFVPRARLKSGRRALDFSFTSVSIACCALCVCKKHTHKFVSAPVSPEAEQEKPNPPPHKNFAKLYVVCAACDSMSVLSRVIFKPLFCSLVGLLFVFLGRRRRQRRVGGRSSELADFHCRAPPAFAIVLFSPSVALQTRRSLVAKLISSQRRPI